MRSQAPSTKGFNYGDDQFCKFCGDYIGDFACYNCSNLDPAIIWGENIPCIYCGEYMARCRCEGDHVCIDCNSNPCICDKYTCCPDCGDRWCNGECRHPEPPEPPASTTYTVSLIASGNGSVIGDGEYEVETTADISALCDTNIIFGGWSENSLLVSTSTQYSFNVNSNRCLTGNFHLRDSDCGRLTLKYKTNHLLKAAIMMLNNQKAGNNKEYAYLIASDNMIENFIGEQGKVSFNFNKSSAYRFIVH